MDSSKEELKRTPESESEDYKVLLPCQATSFPGLPKSPFVSLADDEVQHSTATAPLKVRVLQSRTSAGLVEAEESPFSNNHHPCYELAMDDSKRRASTVSSRGSPLETVLEDMPMSEDYFHSSEMSVSPMAKGLGLPKLKTPRRKFGMSAFELQASTESDGPDSDPDRAQRMQTVGESGSYVPQPNSCRFKDICPSPNPFELARDSMDSEADHWMYM